MSGGKPSIRPDHAFNLSRAFNSSNPVTVPVPVPGAEPPDAGVIVSRSLESCSPASLPDSVIAARTRSPFMPFHHPSPTYSSAPTEFNNISGQQRINTSAATDLDDPISIGPRIKSPNRPRRNLSLNHHDNRSTLLNNNEHDIVPPSGQSGQHRRRSSFLADSGLIAAFQSYNE